MGPFPVTRCVDDVSVSSHGPLSTATISGRQRCVMRYSARRMRHRRSPHQLGSEAGDALARAAQTVGLSVRRHKGVDRFLDFDVLTPEGAVIAAKVKTVAVLSHMHQVGWADDATDVLRVVVADQIPMPLRQELNAAGIGWLDRRGHLRLVGRGLFVDADVPAYEPPSSMVGRSQAPISGRAGLASASALLLHPEEPLGVSEIARLANMNPSSISRALATLAGADLAERIERGRYRPLVPELFWTLADVWPRERESLVLTAPKLSQLGLDPFDERRSLGWVMGSHRAAVEWGAPLVLTEDFPATYYLPTVDAAQTAQVLAAAGPPVPPAVGTFMKVAVDPIGLVSGTQQRRAADAVPLAHPLFCALDLSAASRDREALAEWTPPEPFVRVW